MVSLHVIDRPNLPSMLTIDYLARHRGCIPQLAEWAYAEWRPVFDHLRMSPQDVVAAYEKRAQINDLSLGLVFLAA